MFKLKDLKKNKLKLGFQLETAAKSGFFVVIKCIYT